MTSFQLLGNLLSAAVGLGLSVALVLGEPLKARSRGRSLLFGAGAFVASLAMLANRILENPPGVWWWLGVGGMALAVLASVGWLYMAFTLWPKEKAAEGLRVRPAALLLLFGDAFFLAAFRAQAVFAQVVLVFLGCLVLLAFTKVLSVKPQTA